MRWIYTQHARCTQAVPTHPCGTDPALAAAARLSQLDCHVQVGGSGTKEGRSGCGACVAGVAGGECSGRCGGGGGDAAPSTTPRRR